MSMDDDDGHSPPDDERAAELDDIKVAEMKARLRQSLFGVEPEPRKIGRWTLRERLGAGSSGVVYEAHDPKLDRLVAIKLLRSGRDHGTDHGNDVAQQRMLREAWAMAQLSHHHVVQIYDANPLGDRDVYLVMEYIHGSTLRTWQESERSLDEILDVYVQAGRGLAAIHGARLVHRDFKPDNVFVERSGRVVVGDLGLVHADGEAHPPDRDTPPGSETSHQSPSLTGEGAVVGTPVYMAPEQIRGSSTTARSDQFSFCVALYEAVCGVLPFGSPEASLAEQLAALERGEPRPPSDRARLPAWLARILRRGMSVRPEDRYPSMDALLHEIQRGRTRLRPWHLAVAGVSSVGVIVLLLLALLATRAEPSCDIVAEREAGFWRDSRMARLGALLGASQQPEAQVARRELSEAFRRAASSWIKTRASTCADDRKDALSTVQHMLKEHRQSCLVDAERWVNVQLDALLALGAGNQSTSLSEGASRTAAALRQRRDCSNPKIVRLVPELPSPEQKRQNEYLERRLDELEAMESIQGDYPRVEREAREIVEQTWPENKFLHIRALYRLGHVLGSQGQDHEAVQVLLRATDLASEYPDHEMATEIWPYLVKLAADDRQNPGEGRQWLIGARNAMLLAGDHEPEALPEDTGGDVTITVGFSEPLERRRAEYFEARGMVAYLEGNHHAAARNHRWALDIRRALEPSGEGYLIPKSLINLGNALDGLARTASRKGDSDQANALQEQAMNHYREALAIRERTLGTSHPALAEILFNIGVLHTERGELGEARQALERAMRLDSTTHGKDGPGLLRVLLALGNLEIEEALNGQHDRLDQAEALAQQIERIHQRVQATAPARVKHSYYAQERTLIAAVHEIRGDIIRDQMKNLRNPADVRAAADRARERYIKALDALNTALEVYAALPLLAPNSEDATYHVIGLLDAAKLHDKLNQPAEARAREARARHLFRAYELENPELEDEIQALK